MISATYFDGANLRLHAVDLTLDNGLIAIAGGDIVKSYSYAEARMAEPFAHAPVIVDFADGGRCELSEAPAKGAMIAALGFRKSAVMRWQQHWYGALIALALLIASIVSFVQWGVPALAERVVAAMPAAVDKRVGDEAERSLDGRMFTQSRLSDQRIAEIQDILKEVLPAKTRMPIKLRVVEMKDASPNAFALPNGTIMMTDGMIKHIMGEESDIDDDMHNALAGILAHEIGHVEGRHSMRAIARASMLALGSATLFGDFSAVVAGAPVILLNMDYSRQMETAADEFAITRLRETKHTPAALADFFDSLDKLFPGSRDMPRWMKSQMGYISSHPSSEARSARFRAAAAEQEAADEAAAEAAPKAD